LRLGLNALANRLAAFQISTRILSVKAKSAGSFLADRAGGFLLNILRINFMKKTEFQTQQKTTSAGVVVDVGQLSSFLEIERYGVAPNCQVNGQEPPFEMVEIELG